MLNTAVCRRAPRAQSVHHPGRGESSTPTSDRCSRPRAVLRAGRWDRAPAPLPRVCSAGSADCALESCSGSNAGTSTPFTAGAASSGRRRRSRGGVGSWSPPKTDAGRRAISLPAFVLRALEDHLRDYVGADPDSLIFTRPSGLPLRRQDSPRAWTDACFELGLEGIRVHDLRHHAATLIARNPDVTLRELMATIGHSSHSGGAPVPTLHGRAEPGHRRLPRRHHQHGNPRSRGVAHVITEIRGMGVAWSATTKACIWARATATSRQRSEAAGGIEPPYGALRPLPKPLGHAAAPLHGRAVSLTATVARPQPPPDRPYWLPANGAEDGRPARTPPRWRRRRR